MMLSCYLAVPLRDAPASQPLKLVALFQARFALRLWVIAIAVLHFNQRYNLQVSIFPNTETLISSKFSHLDVMMKKFATYSSSFFSDSPLQMYILRYWWFKDLVFLDVGVLPFHCILYWINCINGNVWLWFPKGSLSTLKPLAKHSNERGGSLCFQVSVLIWCSFDTRLVLSVLLNSWPLLTR